LIYCTLLQRKALYHQSIRVVFEDALGFFDGSFKPSPLSEEFLNGQSVFFVAVPFKFKKWAKTLERAFKLASLASKAQYN